MNVCWIAVPADYSHTASKQSVTSRNTMAFKAFCFFSIYMISNFRYKCNSSACKLFVWKDRATNHEWLVLGSAFPFIDLLLRFYCITGHKNMQPTRSFLVSAVSFLLAESNIKILFIKNDRGKLPLSNHLSCCGHHIFNKNSISPRWIIYKYVRNCSDEFAIL